MALTQYSDVTAIFPEDAFNKILQELMIQKPDTFHYATRHLITNKRYCAPIPINPVLQTMGTSRCTEVPKMPIAGADPAQAGLDYCIQVRELAIDFNPGNVITLPPELGSLSLQQFALKGTVCAGLSCGNIFSMQDVQTTLDNVKAGKINKNMAAIAEGKRKLNTGGINFLPFQVISLNCFCLSLYAKLIFIREEHFLKLKLVGIELQDLSPVGLENAIECYLKKMLDEVVFPKAKLALESLSFNAANYFTIVPTPISVNVPFNPDISNNNLSIFLNVN